MTELSHSHSQAMGIGLPHTASLNATIAVVVDRSLPSSELGGRDRDALPQPSLGRRPEPGCVDLREPERSSDEQSCHPH
jgi:hypothetical protein